MKTLLLSHIFNLSPILILVTTALFVLVLDALLPKGDKKLVFILSLLGLLVSAVASFQLWQLNSLSLFNEAIRIDRFSLFFTILSLAISFLTFLSAWPSIKENKFPPGEFSFFLLSCCAGMSLMAWATDLITLFLSLEIMSVTAYILTGIERERLTSSEGALKYFLLGAFSTGFLLYGIALIYASIGSTQFSVLSNYIMTAKQHPLSPLFYTGIGLLTVGLSFKMAVVPFHMWVPDVYEGAPSSITAFMATGIKAVSLAAFIRFFLVTLLPLKADWNTVLLCLAVATMTVGNLAALVQTNIKRMLAYSSIAHAGYIFIAVCATSGQSFEFAISSILFYLIAYGLMTLGAFAIVIYASPSQDKNMISDYAGFGFRAPILGIAMILFMLSFIGVPPTAGFMGKFYLFGSAIKSQLFWLAIVGIINSVISSYYYLRVLVAFYMTPGHPEQQVIPKAEGLRDLPFSLGIVLVITTAGVLLLGIFPTQIFNIILKSVTPLL